MHAYQLIIEAKVKDKDRAFGIVSPDDFQFREGDALDPRIVIQQPHISLYCLDHAHRRAIFVETPADVNLLQAPFYFIAQYEMAQRLIAVPYNTLHELAAETQIDPERIILVYSTGRCGSTLISRVFDQTADVASFSEPDVFTQLLVLWSAHQADGAEVATLLHDCLMIMSANARHLGKKNWVFKFRSYVMSLGDLLYQAVPEAKAIFLYREPVAWATSFARAFGVSDEVLAEIVPETYRWLIPLVDQYVRSHGKLISYPTYLAYMWVSCIQAALCLQRHGASVFTARYEDIMLAPHEVIAAMYNHCGIPLPDLVVLNHTLATDSQAGTVAARSTTERQAARALTQAELQELQEVVGKFSPAITPEMIIPETFRI